MPETGVHLELRTALYLLVRDFVGERGAVGSDQILYWDPSDPRECLAPDLIVRMGAVPGPFPTWKTWERGAPHIAVEVASPFDAGEAEWQRKLTRYYRCGINEIARFDPEDAERPLRLWDRFEGDLVERSLDGEHALLCDALGVHWCVQSDARPRAAPFARRAGANAGSYRDRARARSSNTHRRARGRAAASLRFRFRARGGGRSRSSSAPHAGAIYPHCPSAPPVQRGLRRRRAVNGACPAANARAGGP